MVAFIRSGYNGAGRSLHVEPCLRRHSHQICLVHNHFLLTVNISQYSQQAAYREGACPGDTVQSTAAGSGGGDCGEPKRCLALWLQSRMFLRACTGRPHTPQVAPCLSDLSMMGNVEFESNEGTEALI